LNFILVKVFNWKGASFMFSVNPKFAVEKKDKNYGRFIIEPLPYGYGMTLGNSLRRVLLTSLLGSAIVQVKIEGVKHEFDVIPGVKEDVVEIILNLKKVKIKLDKPSVVLNLDVKGPGVVAAKSIDVPTGVTILNPDQAIATLSSPKTRLKIELLVEQGMGFLPAEERESSEIGVIPIDAIHAPVLRVDYSISATRVGRMTNFDKLTLEISTDGSIDPQEALKKGAVILKNYFEFINDPSIVKEEEKVETKEEAGVDLKLTLEELDLPTRVVNSLHAINVTNLGELIQKSEKEIMSIKNVGAKSVTEVKKKIEELGLFFRQDEGQKNETSKKRKKTESK